MFTTLPLLGRSCGALAMAALLAAMLAVISPEAPARAQAPAAHGIA